MENDWVFKLLFCISFYVTLRFNIIFSYIMPTDEKIKPNVLIQYFIVFPLITLFILGLMIMKWYIFLLFVLFCFFDPLMQISPRNYFQKIKPYSIKFVDDFFYTILFSSYIIMIIFYYTYFYEM